MIQTLPPYMQHLSPGQIWPMLPMTNKKRCIAIQNRRETYPFFLMCWAEPVPRNDSTSFNKLTDHINQKMLLILHQLRGSLAFNAFGVNGKKKKRGILVIKRVRTSVYVIQLHYIFCIKTFQFLSIFWKCLAISQLPLSIQE